LKLFEDPVIAEGIVDRLKSPSQQLKLKGPSYRDRLAAKNQNNRSTNFLTDIRSINAFALI
jgi:hypothetical protein